MRVKVRINMGSRVWLGARHSIWPSLCEVVLVTHHCCVGATSEVEALTTPDANGAVTGH